MQQSKYRLGVWRLADPKISLASFAGMFMAACFAAADIGINVGWLALTVLGIFCVEVAKNASGELVDFDSGTDQAVSEENRSPFSGGKRVLVDGLLSKNETRNIAVSFFLAAIAIGLTITIFRDSRVLVFGVMGIALAFFYHGGPLRLVYRGFGELAVAIAYGPLVVCGTYFVQTGNFSAPLTHGSIALGILIMAFLWINEFPDYDADKACGKNNMVVRLGRETATLAYTVILASGYIWLALCANYYHTPGILLGGIGIAPAAFSAWRLMSYNGVTRALIPAQVACLLSFIFMACGSGIGYWVGS